MAQVQPEEGQGHQRHDSHGVQALGWAWTQLRPCGPRPHVNSEAHPCLLKAQGAMIFSPRIQGFAQMSLPQPLSGTWWPETPTHSLFIWRPEI